MFSFLRAPEPPRTDRTSRNFIAYKDGASSLGFRSSDAEYPLRNAQSPFDKTKPQSNMAPPLHNRIKQTEQFRIVDESCHLYRDSSEKPWVTLPGDDIEAQKLAVIPKKLYRVVNNATDSEPPAANVNRTSDDLEGEERFFRNFFGYLDDCKNAGQEPSFFQLMVFLRSTDTPLGLPLPSRCLGLVASRLFVNTMGWWGYWVLGYQDTYSEYCLNNSA